MKRTIALVLMFAVLVLSCVFVALYPQSDDVPTDDIVLIDGHLAQVEQPMNNTMADYAIRLFSRVHDEHLSSNDCYFALIPDKYKYLGDKENEYTEFYDYMCSGLSFATPIELYDLLSADDYYRTDPHWRQDKIIDVAKRINGAIGVECDYDFTEVATVSHFVGNYAQRSDIAVSADDLTYLSNDVIDDTVIKEGIPVYDLTKLSTTEPYDFFLSGNQSVVTIKNDRAENDKRLIIFRDSFASSLAPLLVDGYSEIVLVDLRYVLSDMVADYVDFSDADVLFLYSTTLLNNSFSMK